MAAVQDPLKKEVFRSVKRTRDMFLSEHGKPFPLDAESQEIKIKVKVSGEYERVKDYVAPDAANKKPADSVQANPLAGKAPSEVAALEASGKLAKQPAAANGDAETAHVESTTEVGKLIDSTLGGYKAGQSAGGVVALRTAGPGGQVAVAGSGAGQSQALQPRQAPQVPKPKWHPPWKLYRVIAGHAGWVRALAFDPTNQWFCTGSNDRTIKIWDLASGQLKLTLTGHVSHVRAVGVKCWDLECNKVIRNYHGHLSAVYSLSIHPTLDVIVTGSRDATARVWDMRTKQCVHVLSGHTDAVATVMTQSPNPQVTTASFDSTVRLWDIAAGKTLTTLTNHKKAVRAACMHPTEFTFASGSADNIKKWRYPNGDFMLNMDPHKAVINGMAVNADDVMVTAADNGTLQFYDYKTGYNFQKYRAPPQPGSLESEAGVYALSFDQSGSRIVTAEADKSIKLYREDENATEESHPVVWRPDLRKKKF